MRLLLGLLAGQRFQATLTGDASLLKRPMKRVVDPLRQMGAKIEGSEGGDLAPLTILGSRLHGIEFDNQVRSAQVKSAILIAGLYANGKTKVLEEIPSRDHTERLMESAKALIEKEGPFVSVEKTGILKPLNLTVPGDFSAASFFIAAASAIEGSELEVQEVGLNPTRTGLLNVLERMGADIVVTPTSSKPEPMGTIRVKGKKLKATQIEKNEIPALIDELPILMTLMALADGVSEISGAEELRVKETDRIRSMVENLIRLGAKIQEKSDGCVIEGGSEFAGGEVQGYWDHRTVMSMAMASLVARAPIQITDFESVMTSYPGFLEDFNRLCG